MDELTTLRDLANAAWNRGRVNDTLPVEEARARDVEALLEEFADVEPTDAQRVKVCQEIWNEPTLDPSIGAMLLAYEARIRARMARGRRSQSND